ncbi:MAG: hypothetical protein IJI66_02625 [Erysipelotrichaceae bacterium]|nr:hypothetical protein [Erysipelotrichaceae bacterium]
MTNLKGNTYKNPHLNKKQKRKILRLQGEPARGRPRKHFTTEVNKKENWYSPDDVLKDLEAIERKDKHAQK